VAEIDLAATQWVDLDFPDDYDSDPDTGNTILFVALTGGSATAEDGVRGDVYLIEGVAAGDGDSNAIGLFDLADEDLVDVTSIAVSGDTADAVILAGATWSPTVYRSTNAGLTFSEATKRPAGEWLTNVCMAPGAFDPGEGVAYASRCGIWKGSTTVHFVQQAKLVTYSTKYSMANNPIPTAMAANQALLSHLRIFAPSNGPKGIRLKIANQVFIRAPNEKSNVG
jgi:hypothetical protein